MSPTSDKTLLAAGLILIYATIIGFTDNYVRVIAAEARRRGMVFAGHVSLPTTVVEAAARPAAEDSAMSALCSPSSTSHTPVNPICAMIAAVTPLRAQGTLHWHGGRSKRITACGSLPRARA